MAQAVKYLHMELNVLHRDLSCNAWFVVNNKEIILADFSIASKLLKDDLAGYDFMGDVKRLADTYIKMLGGVENP